MMIKIAAVQMVSTPDVARNLDTARRLVAQAAEAGATLVAQKNKKLYQTARGKL